MFPQSPQNESVGNDLNTVAEKLISQQSSDLASTQGMDGKSAGVINLDAFFSLVEAGGPVVVVLIFMSVISLTVTMLKLWQFQWHGLNRFQLISSALKAWHLGNKNEAIEILYKKRSPLAKVLKHSMMIKLKSFDKDLVQQEILRVAKRELNLARSNLKILEVIATLSPLIGLLGTVLGMITAFQKLQGAGSTIDPALLSGGIWEALLTTAAGLIVAIPTVMALSWLEQRVEHFKSVMEDVLSQVFTSEIHSDLSSQIKTNSPVNSKLPSIMNNKVQTDNKKIPLAS